LERGSRPVRHQVAVSPAMRRRTGDSECPEGRRGGERRRHAPQSVCTRRRHERSSHALRGRVLRSVLRPVHVNPHYTPGDESRSVVGRASRHHGWANSGNRDEPTLGSARTDEARLAACHSCRKARAWHVQEKEGDRGLRPCEDQEPVNTWFGCSHVEVQLQKSIGDNWSRISSAYALQKEWSGSSERGPSSERGSAGETVGRRVE